MRPDWWKRVEQGATVLRVKRRVRQWLGLEVQSRAEVRCLRVEPMGWWLCLDRMPRGGVAYCFELVIAHCLSTVRKADRIVVMRVGRVVDLHTDAVNLAG